MAKIVKNLSQFEKATKNFPNAAKDLVGTTTGSMVLDLLSRNKIGKTRALTNLRRCAIDADMKMGAKLYDKNVPFKNLLLKDHFISKGTPNNVREKGMIIKTTGITNPFERAKSVVLPTVGSFVIADKIYNSKQRGEAHEQ